jgi:hypothetical protein
MYKKFIIKMNDFDLEQISHLSVMSGENEAVEGNRMHIDMDFPNNLSCSRGGDADRDIKFKNYIPSDKENFQVERVTYFTSVESIEKAFEKKVKKAVREFVNLEKNPLNIVPKKNNLDLKRSLAGKLEKLNRRTEIAILEIISKI